LGEPLLSLRQLLILLIQQQRLVSKRFLTTTTWPTRRLISWSFLPRWQYTTCMTDATANQRVQNSANVTNLDWNWSTIQIHISGLIRLRVQISAGSFQNCCGFITDLVDCTINANKSAKIRYSAMVKQVEKWSEIRIWRRITTSCSDWWLNHSITLQWISAWQSKARVHSRLYSEDRMTQWDMSHYISTSGHGGNK